MEYIIVVVWCKHLTLHATKVGTLSWRSIGLALVFVIPVVMVLFTLHPGVVPDNLAPGEHTVGVRHHSGHVVDKSGSLFVVVELHFTLVDFTVLSARVGGVHHNVLPSIIV